MVGASEYLTDAEAAEVTPFVEPTEDKYAYVNESYERQNAARLAVDLMTCPNYSALLSGAIVANFEHLSNKILNYIKTGKVDV